MPDPNQLSPDPGQDVLRVDAVQLADLEQRLGPGAAEQVADVGGTAVDGSGVTREEQIKAASTDQDGMIRYPAELLGELAEPAPREEPAIPRETPMSQRTDLTRVGGTDALPQYAPLGSEPAVAQGDMFQAAADATANRFAAPQQRL